jgi:hypothetical protein
MSALVDGGFKPAKGRLHGPISVPGGGGIVAMPLFAGMATTSIERQDAPLLG